VYSWVTNRDEAGANWVGGEKSVYLAPGNSGTIIGGIHTFSVLKQGNVVTFMLNGVPCLQSTHTDFSGDCTVGLFAHGQSYTAYNGIFIQEEAKLNEIAQERGIVGDEVLLDGTISSSEWNLGKVIEQKASNGEYNKYSVVLGRAFIYVLGEMGTFNYRDDATVMDGTEEDSELESSITYKTWSNTNIEIRSYNEGESQTNYYRRAYLNAVLNSASVANFTFNKAIKTVGGQDLHVITYEIMIPYTTFGYSNPTNFTYLLVAVKPGVVSASSTQLYSNSELGGSWWTNGQKHYVTANGIV